MSPHSGNAASKPDLGANQEGSSQEYLSVATLSRTAAHVVAVKNLPISGSRVRKLVRRFVREGRADIDFRTWFISYADPTGETAVRKVMGRAKVGERGGR